MIHERWSRFERSLPPAMRQSISRYRRTTGARLVRFDREKRRTTSGPFWIQLPGWLGMKFRDRSGISPAFIRDVTWAQFCLFFTIRLQDDLLDNQAEDSTLIFVSDQCLLESERALASHMNCNNDFWDYFRTCFERSTRGIMEVQRLQKTHRASLKTLEERYNDVNCVFTIGSAAILHRLRRPRDLDLIGRFVDDVSFVGQLFDDFLDIEEDLEEGKVNYVARYAAGNGTRIGQSGSELRKRITEGIIFTNRLPGLFTTLRTRLDETAAAITPLDLPQAVRYVRSLRKKLESVEERFHAARVNRLFAKILSD